MKCPECESKLTILDELAGTLGNCPACNAEFRIDEPAETGPAVEEEPGTPGSADEDAFDPMDVLGLDEPSAEQGSINPSDSPVPDEDSAASDDQTEPAEAEDPPAAAATQTTIAAENLVAAMRHRVPVTAGTPAVAGSPATPTPQPSAAPSQTPESTGSPLGRVVVALRESRLYAAFAALVLISGIALAIRGCADDGHVPVYAAKGRVVYPDGSPVRTGTIELESVEYGTTSTGRINHDGSFVLGTYSSNDGAPAGEHRVIVVQMVIVDGTVKHTIDHGKPLDPRFSRFETSGVVTKVAASDTNDLVIEVEPAPDYQPPAE